MSEPSMARADAIEGYELGAPIARDRLGIAYAARRGPAAVAVKIFAAGDPQGGALLLDEVVAAGALHQPNILDVVDLGELPDGRRYVTTELLEGESLAVRLQRVRKLPLEDAVEFTRQAAGALAAAHEAGVVHGALRPEALFLVADLSLPRGERVKLRDFGTRLLRARAGGAEAYLAPEVPAGGEPDPRADVYALGAVLHRAVCGVAPQLAGGALVRPRLLDRDVPRPLENVLLRALARDPAARFPSMAAFVSALEGEAAKRPPTRRPVVRFASVVMGVIIVGVVASSSRAPARTALVARGRAIARTISRPLVARPAPTRHRRAPAPRRPVILPLPSPADTTGPGRSPEAPTRAAAPPRRDGA
jgi:serine/threonine protein kinase